MFSSSYILHGRLELRTFSESSRAISNRIKKNEYGTHLLCLIVRIRNKIQWAQSLFLFYCFFEKIYMLNIWCYINWICWYDFGTEMQYLIICSSIVYHKDHFKLKKKSHEFKTNIMWDNFFFNLKIDLNIKSNFRQITANFFQFFQALISRHQPRFLYIKHNYISSVCISFVHQKPFYVNIITHGFKANITLASKRGKSPNLKKNNINQGFKKRENHQLCRSPPPTLWRLQFS